MTAGSAPVTPASPQPLTPSGSVVAGASRNAKAARRAISAMLDNNGFKHY
jgi:hypothetical protein